MRTRALVQMALLSVAAAFRLAAVFSPHMVFQRETRLSIWGAATPGSSIKLVLQQDGSPPHAALSTTASADGTWVVPFGPLNGSFVPYTMTFTTSEGDSVYLADVLVGDVYFCSGQSNMQISVDYTFNAAAAIAASAAYGGGIRLMQLARTSWSFTPQAELQVPPDTLWSRASPAVVPGFSAVCWFMLRDIYDALNGTSAAVPLAGISANWGATSIQTWSGPAACAACGGCPPSYNGWVPPGPTHPGNTSVLRNAMLLPFMGPASASPAARYPASGVAWYQGEDNAMAMQADYYACAVRELAAEMRTAFGSPRLWFGVVQLAPWTGNATALGFAVGALRRAQQAGVAAGGADMSIVTAADVGDPLSSQVIHPRNKATPGARLARAALSVRYNRSDLAAQGPVAVSATSVTQGRYTNVTVAFEAASVVGGLHLTPPTAGDYFSYCPVELHVPADNCAWYHVRTLSDQVFNATAYITGGGDTLTLAIDTYPAIRLAVAETFAGDGLWPVMGLRNAAGFPAFPFRLPVTPA